MATRVGFIGLGLIARMHWEHLATRDDVKLAGFCDIDEDRLYPPAQKYDAPAFIDYRDMLADAGLDAVYICVPPYVDGPIELDCIAAGLPMFVEKPVALNMATARRVEAAIAETNTLCSVGYHWRYMGATELAREMLGDEEIGFVQGHWVGGVPAAFWWPQLALSGGQMTEQCTHIVDLARYFCGEVTQVTAAGARGIMCKRFERHNIWDSQAAVLTFANGVVASIHTSNLAQHCPDNGMTIFTPESSFKITEAPWSSKLIVQRCGQSLTFTGQDRGWKEPRFIEDDVFIEAVRTGDRSGIRCSYTEAVKTLAVNLAINKATETGQTVKPADMG